MKPRRVLLLVLFLAVAVFAVNAQRRTTGQTREDQHPASSTSTSPRGEQRAPDPPPPPQHHDPPPPPVQGTVPAPPPHPYPVGGYPIEGTAPVVILVPVSPDVPEASEPVAMWPVVGTEIIDRLIDPGNSGYRFDREEVVPFNDDAADVYYEAQDSLLHVADDSDIQDLGVAGSVREDLRVPRNGWVTGRAVEVHAGHQYAVWRWNGEIVRLYIQQVVDDAVVFDWMPGRSMERTGVKGPIFGR